MFERVLIPIDGSALASKILVPLRRLLSRDAPAQVILFHVHDGAPDPAVQQTLLEVSRLCGAAGLPGTVQMREGEPAETILQGASQNAVDLIAMATHGRSGLTRLVRGSVAERVLRGADVPLLLCNPAVLEAGEAQDPAFQRILVPYDGSEVAARVLPAAATLAQAYDATLVLLRVENFSAGGGHSELEDVDMIEHKLRPTVTQLRDLGAPEVEVKVEVGNEIDLILKTIDEERIDLLCMSSHGRGGVARWWFGSTAEGVLRAARCPVYVTRTVNVLDGDA